MPKVYSPIPSWEEMQALIPNNEEKELRIPSLELEIPKL